MLEYFLGIDPSATSTGLTLLSSSGCCEVHLIKPRKLRDCERLQYISSDIKSFIRGKNITLCVYETPSYGSTHKEFILGEVLGTIKLTVSGEGITMVGAAPTQLKKYITGSGRATKECVVENAVRLGCTSKQEDLCDSFAAALLCKDIVKGPLLSTRASREVRTSILKKHSTLGYK